MKITSVLLETKKVAAPLTLAVVADLHDSSDAVVREALRAASPDLVLVPGDILHDAAHTENGLATLRRFAAAWPTFVSVGNHEWKCGVDVRPLLAATGACLLDNAFVRVGEVVIGGLSSGYEKEKQGRFKKTPPPRTAWLSDFCAEDGYRVLLCHHPEYYRPYIKGRDIDLTVAGHAHGGQWRFFGIPVFAPGQGLFPRYTSGLYDGKLLVSRGLANHVSIPRLFNPTELVVVKIVPQ